MPALPKANGLRRNRSQRVGPQNLPANGRKGRTPAWPLDYPPTDSIKRMWVDYWHSPQAVVWEIVGCQRAVALFCQLEDQINAGSTVATVLTKHGQLQDRLGLTPKAMRAMLWEIADDAPKHDTAAVMDEYRRGLERRQRLQVTTDDSA